ncbi:hypothetical protein BJY01DRAFT_257223 [Aspergillus pseudoustus]|uniref:Altered inheritance of mitochondria protein 9, mitochondrial n=1 Tax=Aspergillus pseudoustus TaxID=1810923 RepID=A0ABR4JLG4_9EURO
MFFARHSLQTFFLPIRNHSHNDNEVGCLANRYREFNERKLLDLAAGLITQGSVKCRLDSDLHLPCECYWHNKAYVLTMSNGDELVARLPNPNAGPQTTASEVATRSFVSPRILASSADATNVVGAEYIIEEQATGPLLRGLWAQMSKPARLGIIDQLIDVEKKLASVCFPRLEFGFALGPLNDRRLWQAERSQMPLNRGPWVDLADHAVAIGTNEVQWAGSHAVTPYLVSHLQKTSSGYARNTLSHPDLHLDNIFIDPNTNRITCNIDWQSAAIAPLAQQRSHSQMLELSPNPLSDEQHNQENELLDYYHKAAKVAALPRPPYQNCDRYFSVCLTPLTLSLISVAAHWDNLDFLSDDHKTQTPCPINFTSEELQAHERESELISDIAGIVQQLDEQGLIPIGGMVPADEYNNARAISESLRNNSWT